VGWNESEHPRDEAGRWIDAELHEVSYTNTKGEAKIRKEWQMPGGQPMPEHLGKTKLPPGWQRAQVSTDPSHPVIARGIDAKGREQRIYSQAHVERQAAAKFARVQEGIAKIEAMRKQNTQSLGSPDSSVRETAAVWRLINHTGIRPGSDRDTKAEKQAYGATTLLGRHVTQDSVGQVTLRYIGKKGVDLSIPVTDSEIAADLLRRKQVAGEDGRLFQTDANALLNYSHSLDGGGFKTKDVRTIRGTMEAQRLVAQQPKPRTERERRKAILSVGRAVAGVLGNTATVALQSYIDPHTFDPWKLEQQAT